VSGLRERRRLELRHRIERAALELFARDGYDAVSMEAIAAEVEVSPSTLFRHVESKEDLLVGVVRTGRRRILDRFAELADADADATGALAEAILHRTSQFADETELVERWRAAMASAPTRVRRASLLDEAERGELTALVAERMGVDAADDVRPGALVAAHLAAAEHAYAVWLAAEPGPGRGLDDLTREALAVLAPERAGQAGQAGQARGAPR
jgi:AcrR family transcriptional regulator